MGKHSKSKKGSKDRERDKGSKGAISKLIASPEKMVHKLQVREGLPVCAHVPVL